MKNNTIQKLGLSFGLFLVSILPVTAQIDEIRAINTNLDENVEELDSIRLLKEWEAALRWEDSIKKVLYPDIKLDSIPISERSNKKPATKTTLTSTATKSLTLSSGSGVRNSSVPTTVTIDKSKPVGEIPITSSVTPSGAVYYSVPIEVYPGVNGVQPQLSIGYNSQSGNGPLGVGWYISGLSSIRRVDNSIYYDGSARHVRLFYDDAFSLDGVRLIRVSDLPPYIYNGFEWTIDYLSEQGNIKVKAYIYEGEVRYFTVSYPSGQTATYGYSTNTSSKLDYPLTQMSDLFGNSITYNYTETNNQYRVSSIDYGAGSVTFQYVNRLDTLVSFKTGLKLIEDRILEQISCTFNGYTLRNYNLSYAQKNSESFLSTIGYAAPDGTQLNPLQFYYGENNTATEYTSEQEQMSICYLFDNPGEIKAVRGNFNAYGSENDGIITLLNKNPYWQHTEDAGWFHNSVRRFENLYSASHTILAFASIGDGNNYVNHELTTGSGFIDIFCANVDGEVEDEVGEEIIKVNNVVSGNNDQVTFRVYSQNSYLELVELYSRIFNFPTVITDASGSKSVQPKYYYPGDYNGDGKIEILVVSCNRPFNWNNYPTNCYLIDVASGTILYDGQPFTYNVSFVGNEQQDPTVAYNNTDRLMVMDYNGDGKTDICLINEQGTYVYTINYTGSTYSFSVLVNGYTELNRSGLANRLLLPGELNGDGNTDFLVSPLVGGGGTLDYYWTTYCSKGIGSFEKSILAGGPIFRGSNANFFLQDVNSDGISDLIEHRNYTNNDNLYTYIIRNKGFTYEGTIAIPNGNSLVLPTNINNRKNSHQILSLKDHSITLYSYPRNDSKEKLLTGMVTSLGVVNKNYYNTLIKSQYYTKGSGASYPYENYQGSYIITEEQEQYVDGSLKEQLRYEYSNAVIHKQGLGFRSFEGMITRDLLRGRDYIKQYNPLNFSVLTKEETPLFVKDYTYSITVASNKIAKINLQSLVSKDKLNSTPTVESLTTSTYTYDTYGNPLTASINYGGGITETVSNTYVNNTSESGYLLGFLTDQTVTKSRNGASSYIQRSYIPTYNNGLPLKRNQYINGIQVLEQDFVYNNRGSLTQKSERAYSSANTQISSYAYDAIGRITKETDALGLFTDYEYHPTKGIVSAIKNHKGQATTFGYDSFLRKTSMLNPDGTTASTKLVWNTAGNSGLYYVTDSAQGKPRSRTYYDVLGRVVATSIQNMLGLESRMEKTYDSFGRLSGESLPFTGSAPSLWKTYQYDAYDRPSSIVEATGNTTTYSYGIRSVTTTLNGISKTKTVDTRGNTIQIVDPAGTITYNLRADGQPSSIVAPGNVTTSFTYDDLGRQLTITDPSAGTQTYVYNNDGNLASETNANNQVISYTYDAFNRLTQKVQPEFTTAYNYNADGLLESMVSNNGTSKLFTYDEYLRLQKEKEMVVDGKWLEKTYTLSGGQLTSTQYASQSGTIVTENYTYNKGHLREVKLTGLTPGSKSIWRLDTVNAMGQPTSAYTGNFFRKYGYDAYGYPVSRKAGTFQDFTYDYDVARGNLNSRATINHLEEFTYDNLDRLTGSSLGIDNVTVQYDNLGNLLQRSDVGTFTYGSASAPYRITAASTTGNTIPMRNRITLFNSFQRPCNISEGEYSAYFVYNADGDRVKMGMLKNDTTVMNKYYLSDCYEIDEKSDGTVKQKLYLNGDYYTATTVLIKNNSQAWGIYYICRDQLGSITHIRNATGTVVQELSYDAWGRMRNPSTMQVYAPGSEPEPYIGRGYGGHEYLKPFGLVNMNARLYDPTIGRFLSPDPYVQAPGNSQNFNRYSYCLNNPLKYSDPDGELIISWIVGFVKGFSRSISGNHEDGHHTWFGDGWASANRHAENTAKIIGGLFAADTDREGWGWQIWNRLTRETPQTILGFGAAWGENIFGQVDNVGYCEGATVVTAQGDAVFFGLARAYTLGSYIIGNNELQPNVYNWLFQHEYGHYLQSQASGWFYLPFFAIPSMINANTSVDVDDYLSRDTEQDAQARSLLYLTKYVDGFDYDDWDYNNARFFSDRFSPDPRSKINEAFLKKKLMYQNIWFE